MKYRPLPIEVWFAVGIVVSLAFIVWFSLRGTPERAVEHSRIMVIDECEYLVFQNSLVPANNYNLTITHKGNCANPVHRINGGNRD